MSECLQTFLVFSNGAPRHSVTIQAASYDVIVVKLHARDRSVMTVEGLEMKESRA